MKKIGLAIFSAIGGAGASAATVALYIAVGSAMAMQTPLGLVFGLFGFIAAIPIALAHALLIGVPLYALLALRWRAARWSAALWGFLIGALPIGLRLYAPYMPSDALPGGVLADGGRALLFGLVGAVGGLAFVCILRKLEVETAGDAL